MAYDEKQIAGFPRRKVSMIFQDPMNLPQPGSHALVYNILLRLSRCTKPDTKLRLAWLERASILIDASAFAMGRI